MPIRVTSNSSISQSLMFARKHAADIGRMQLQISSGLRVHRPSDDPAGTRALLSIQTQSERLTADLSNISATRNSLNVSFTHLQDAQQVFVQAKQLALQARQATEPAEIQGMVDTVDSLVRRLIAIGNARFDGEYLFAGTATTQPPFVVADGTITNGDQIQYVGSDQRVRTVIGDGLFADRVYTGGEVFLPRARSGAFFGGATGAASGSSVDTAIGQNELLVRHTATSFAAGSGVQAGTSSPAGDTIIGSAGVHTLTVNDVSGSGAFGTISLNGAPPFDFTSGDTDLQVLGPLGEVIHVDTTTIVAGFNGTVDITADGTLSVDGGLSEVAIDFTSNQAVTDSETQAVTYIDSTNMQRIGTDRIEYSGTSSAFQVLLDFRDELLNANQTVDADWHAALGRRIGDIDRMHEHFLGVVAEQSVTLEQLDVLENRFSTLQLEHATQASEIASADISQLVIQLQQSQSLLQFTLASSARLFDQSLLDFIR